MATTIQIKTVAGYGYMRNGEAREEIPPHTIRGHHALVDSCQDPVRIGDYVVEQADLDVLYQHDGFFPLYLVVDDHSGSYRYLFAINWREHESLQYRHEGERASDAFPPVRGLEEVAAEQTAVR